MVLSRFNSEVANITGLQLISCDCILLTQRRYGTCTRKPNLGNAVSKRAGSHARPLLGRRKRPRAAEGQPEGDAAAST